MLDLILDVVFYGFFQPLMLGTGRLTVWVLSLGYVRAEEVMAFVIGLAVWLGGIIFFMTHAT